MKFHNPIRTLTSWLFSTSIERKSKLQRLQQLKRDKIILQTAYDSSRVSAAIAIMVKAPLDPLAVKPWQAGVKAALDGLHVQMHAKILTLGEEAAKLERELYEVSCVSVQNPR